MSADLVLAEDGLTVEFDNIEDCADLSPDQAEAVTGRIRQWVNDFPIEDVVLAFRGRIWIALAYDSWTEWCECELGGLKLPAPKRREVVASLSGTGMSNRAIADAIGSSEPTVRRDLTATASNGAVDPDRKTLGQDGRERSNPQRKATPPEVETVEAQVVCRDCDGYGCETCFSVGDPELPPDPYEDDPVSLQARKVPEKPITKQFWTANYELTKAVQRVVRLSENDRFKKNKDQISGCHLSDLIRARDAINGVIQQLEG